MYVIQWKLVIYAREKNAQKNIKQFGCMLMYAKVNSLLQDSTYILLKCICICWWWCCCLAFKILELLGVECLEFGKHLQIIICKIVECTLNDF